MKKSSQISKPTSINRNEFDAAIFALDGLFREERMKEQGCRNRIQ